MTFQYLLKRVLRKEIITGKNETILYPKHL